MAARQARSSRPRLPHRTRTSSSRPSRTSSSRPSQASSSHPSRTSSGRPSRTSSSRPSQWRFHRRNRSCHLLRRYSRPRRRPAKRRDSCGGIASFHRTLLLEGQRFRGRRPTFADQGGQPSTYGHRAGNPSQDLAARLDLLTRAAKESLVDAPSSTPSGPAGRRRALSCFSARADYGPERQPHIIGESSVAHGAAPSEAGRHPGSRGHPAVDSRRREDEVADLVRRLATFRAAREGPLPRPSFPSLCPFSCPSSVPSPSRCPSSSQTSVPSWHRSWRARGCGRACGRARSG